jgi:hypothetical protein
MGLSRPVMGLLSLSLSLSLSLYRVFKETSCLIRDAKIHFENNIEERLRGCGPSKF